MRFTRLNPFLLCLCTVVCVSSQLQAQRDPTVVSPQVEQDRKVTFRLLAPNAQAVGLNVQFAQGTVAMTKGQNGLWQVTVGPAEPEIYEYNFIVDGFQVADPANSWLKFWGGAAKNLVLVPGDPPMFFQEQRVSHGTVHVHKYASKTLGVTRGLYVYTPPGYEESPQTKYPVLYLLHGMGDTEDAWTVVGRANLIVDNLLAANKARPLVIVMPYGHTPSAPPDMRSLGNYAAFEKDLVEDVIPYVQKCYRVSTEQKDRAIAGLSMGGGQALTVGLGHLELFGWLGAYSSAVPRDQSIDKLLAEPKTINDKLRLFWIGCGSDDFLFKQNQAFVEELKAKKIRYSANITEGAHEWRIWRRYLNEFVPLLFRMAAND